MMRGMISDLDREIYGHLGGRAVTVVPFQPAKSLVVVQWQGGMSLQLVLVQGIGRCSTFLPTTLGDAPHFGTVAMQCRIRPSMADGVDG